MDAVISSLTDGLTSTAFFAVVDDVMPFVIVLVPFVLGLTILRKLIKGASKGKVRL